MSCLLFLPQQVSTLILQYARSYVDRIARCLLSRYFMNDNQVLRFPICYSCKTSFVGADSWSRFAPQRELAMLQCATCGWRRCARGHVENCFTNVGIIECSEMLENGASSKPVCVEVHDATSFTGDVLQNVFLQTIVKKIEDNVANCACFQSNIPNVPKILSDIFPHIGRLPYW